jgi:predicted Holliday junction resolvase-like endonuclease
MPIPDSMLGPIAGAVVGLIVGVVVAVFVYAQRVPALAHQRAEKMAQERFILMQSSLEASIKQTYEARLDQWRQSELVAAVQAARREALQQSRVTLKGRIGEQLAPLLPEFFQKFEPADARFIGSPIDYVIFKNLSHVDASASDGLIEVFIVDVKTGNAVLTRAERLIKEAVERGAVHFLTLHLSEPATLPPDPEPGTNTSSSQ